MTIPEFSFVSQTSGATLTDYEIDALSRSFNFADGHARYSIAQHYSSIVGNFPQLLTRTYNQDEVEHDFGKTFFALGGQTAPDDERMLYCPSASISIELAANYLRMNNLSVSLIEPIFDNLADCIKRHNIPLKPLKESILYDENIAGWQKTIDTDAIFLVIPNNPTGYLLSPSFFAQIVDFCVKTNKLLLLDFSFRFFIPEAQIWDQYQILEQSGVRYIAIEDTGKTWPTFEIKVSPFTGDTQTFPALRSIYRDIFICHSPLALAFVGEFVKASLQEGAQKCFQNIVTANRTLLRQTIADTPLKPLSNPLASVEWIQIENTLDDLEVVKYFQTYGVHILPGKQFFWSGQQNSSKFVRVALMRDTQLFAKGMDTLQDAISGNFKNR